MTSINIYDYISQPKIDRFVPTFLYLKQHRVTGLLYFGKTRKQNIIKYNGSGTVWLNHLKKHGALVDTLWYCLFTDPISLVEAAVSISQSHNIVKSPEYANLLTETGLCGWYPGSARYTLPDGSVKVLSKIDPQIQALGLKKSAERGMYKDATTGKYISKRISDIDPVDVTLVGFHTGKAVYVDRDGHTISCKVDDPRIAAYEYWDGLLH
jgi:hypothetical protein